MMDLQALEKAFPIGPLLDRVTITQVHKGLSCSVADGVMGFVPKCPSHYPSHLLLTKLPFIIHLHIKRITDNEITLHPTTGPWKLLSTHPVRVLSIPLDGVLILTLQEDLQEDLIGQAFLSASDVHIGQIVKVRSFLPPGL